MTEPPEITERERDLTEPEPPAPYSVVWRLLRDREGRERESRDRARAAARSVATLADDVGLALHQLREYARSPGADRADDLLSGIVETFAAALHKAGARVVEPTGRGYAEVAELVEIVYAEDGVPQERLVVSRTVVAGLVMDDGRLVRRAAVELGAPPSRTEDQPG